MSLLQVNNLHTVLDTPTGSVEAVRGIDFDIGQGETLCLVGESGSGKSVTALSIMQLLPAGLARHPQGKVLLQQSGDSTIDLFGLHEDAMTEVRGRRMSMIFQEPMSSLNPVFTVGEQITEALKLSWPQMPFAEAREIALNSLDEVRIKKPKVSFNEYPHRLSGGQRQRVMIAMALVCRPDLLIADEPTTALDVTVQREILNLIRQLQQDKGTAVLFITHDLGVVAQIADRVAVMRYGQIVEQGVHSQVLYQPEHEYTRSLLSALPENLKKETRVDAGYQTQADGERLKNDEVAEETSLNVIIEACNLRVWFPVRRGLFRRVASHVRAVDDVSLTIQRGEIVALVGESGSGKSTLGRAIVRLLDPTSGRLFYKDNEIGNLSASEFRPYRTDLQVVFQDPLSSLNPRLTIATTLTEPMAVHGVGESHDDRIERAAQLLEDVQLSKDSLWRYPHEFSGGQRQRVGIARALAVNPKFIVCDEVTSALDVSVQAELLQLLLRLRRQYELTLLFITHNISVVEYISDRTLVMHQGKLVEAGATESVCGAPEHPYTKQLIDAVPRLEHGREAWRSATDVK